MGKNNNNNLKKKKKPVGNTRWSRNSGQSVKLPRIYIPKSPIPMPCQPLCCPPGPGCSVLDLKDVILCISLTPASQEFFLLSDKTQTQNRKSKYYWTVLTQVLKHSPTVFEETSAKDQKVYISKRETSSNM